MRPLRIGQKCSPQTKPQRRPLKLNQLDNGFNFFSAESRSSTNVIDKVSQFAHRLVC